MSERNTLIGRLVRWAKRYAIANLRNLDHAELAALKRALRDYDIKRKQWREPIDLPMLADLTKPPTNCQITIGGGKSILVAPYPQVFPPPDALGDQYTAIEFDWGRGREAALRCNRCAAIMLVDAVPDHVCGDALPVRFTKVDTGLRCDDCDAIVRGVEAASQHREKCDARDYKYDERP